MLSSAEALVERPRLNVGAALLRGLRRFVTLYLVFFCVPFPVQLVAGSVSRIYAPGKDAVAAWIGRTLFGIGHGLSTASTQGKSTDRAVDYLWLVALVVLAALGTLAWSLIAPDPRVERKLMQGARVYLRYVLGLELLGYGFFKLLPVQFGELDPLMLTRSVGELPPMRLLWAFMAASKPYTMFAGAAEVVGACLLFWRRTTLLGALILIGVMTNVVLLNVCYDVPIKIKSSHLLGIALYLAAPAASRLWQAVVATRSESSVFNVQSRGWRWMLRLSKLAVITFVAGGLGIHALQTHDAQLAAARDPLHGVWEVESQAEATRWQRVVIHEQIFEVTFADGQRRKLGFERGAATQQLALVEPTTHANVGALEIAHAHDPSAGIVRLLVNGRFGDDTISLQLRRKDDFLLVTRGFHWVNHSPLKAF